MTEHEKTVVDEYQPAPGPGAAAAGGGGIDIKALITPRPSVDFFKSWPNIVELIIRAVCIVSQCVQKSCTHLVSMGLIISSRVFIAIAGHG